MLLLLFLCNFKLTFSSELEAKINEGDIGDELMDKYTSEKERYAKMRRQLAKKTRQVEALKRYIDDIPGRAELSQYQRRFVELYNQSKSKGSK